MEQLHGCCLLGPRQQIGKKNKLICIGPILYWSIRTRTLGHQYETLSISVVFHCRLTSKYRSYRLPMMLSFEIFSLRILKALCVKTRTDRNLDLCIALWRHRVIDVRMAGSPLTCGKCRWLINSATGYRRYTASIPQSLAQDVLWEHYLASERTLPGMHKLFDSLGATSKS